MLAVVIGRFHQKSVRASTRIIRDALNPVDKYLHHGRNLMKVYFSA